jgi:hypothetical protein
MGIILGVGSPASGLISLPFLYPTIADAGSRGKVIRNSPGGWVIKIDVIANS